tara:strand:- start:3307 stop:3540 length:234 start_codon:yes stop_codon:yes gene_type:complete
MINKNQRQVLHHCYAQAKEMIKAGEMDDARDYFDRMIGFTAEKRIEGYGAKDLIEGIRVELWLERAWLGLENNGLLL